MDRAHKITEISVVTKSTEPLSGVVLVSTANAKLKFEITEDVAHKLCTYLERFLTR
jgi:hypothetical protein